MIVVVLLDPHAIRIEHDAADVVLCVGGTNAESARPTAGQRHIVQSDLARNHHVLEVESDRCCRWMVVRGVFGSPKGSVHQVPVAASLFDIESPSLESAGKPGDAPLRR